MLRLLAELALLLALTGCVGADVVYDANGYPLAVVIRGQTHGVARPDAVVASATPVAPAPAASVPEAPASNPPADTLRASGLDTGVAPYGSSTSAGGPFFVALRAAWRAGLAGDWPAARSHSVAATRAAWPQALPDAGEPPPTPQTRPARRERGSETPAVRGVLDNAARALDELEDGE